MAVKIEYQKRKIHTCDICDKKIRKNENPCSLCGGEHCNEHMEQIDFSTDLFKTEEEEDKYEENILYKRRYDEGFYICSKCYKMREEFLNKIVNLIKRNDKELEKIFKEWGNKGLKKNKKEKTKKESTRAELMDLE